MARRKKPLSLEPVLARIESLDHDGRGVAVVEGKVTLIDGALPEEAVMFRYRRRRRGTDEGYAVQVLEPSPDRVVPRCPHFGVCGGCTLQHLRPEAQVRFKQDWLLAHLAQEARTAPDSVLSPLTGPLWGYRRKARLGVRYVPKKQAVLVGFRERGSGFVADLSRCDVLHPSVGQRLGALRDLIGSLESFSQIPQVEVAVGDVATALLLRHLVPLPASDLGALRAFAATHGLRVYLQSGGPDTVCLLAPDGDEELSYELPEWDVVVQFRPTDFAQVNGEINRRMVSLAVELLDPQPHEQVLELFCGLGNFSLPLARRAARVVGVEGEEGLVERARENARRSGAANTEFYVWDLSKPDPRSAWWQAPYDKLLLDPPRSGALEVVSLLRDPYPTRIVYVSCNPATLARDARELVHSHGYRIMSAGVMDMFPHTVHAESIALFGR